MISGGNSLGFRPLARLLFGLTYLLLPYTIYKYKYISTYIYILLIFIYISKLVVKYTLTSCPCIYISYVEPGSIGTVRFADVCITPAKAVRVRTAGGPR